MSYPLAFMLLAAAAAQPVSTTRPAPAAGPKMQPAVRHAFAGVKIAIPVGFDHESSNDHAIVMRAVKSKAGATIVSAVLLAYRWPAKMPISRFIVAARPTTLAVRDFKVIKTMPMTAGRITGTAQVVSFAFEGKPTRAVRIFFARPVPKTNFQLAYILLAEADPKHVAHIIPTLGAIYNTIELFDPIRPGEVTELGEPIVSKKSGFSIRPPKWWKVIRTQKQVVLFQTNYFSPIGVSLPRLLFAVTDAGGEPAKGWADKALESLREKARASKVTIDIRGQAAARMAGAEAYEFLISERPPTSTQPSRRPRPGREPYTIAHRVVCLHGNSYALTIIHNTRDAKKVWALLDKVAGGIKLMPPVAPPATTAPAGGKGPVLPPLR